MTKNMRVLSFCVLLLAGCSVNNPKNISYYHFSIAKPALEFSAPFNRSQIKVMPTKMPDYINTLGIAQRIDNHRAKAANWHLWATKPSEMLSASAVNLLQTALLEWLVVGAETDWLNNDGAVAQGEQYLLQLVLERFNGGLNNDAELVGTWLVFDKKNQVLHRKNFSLSIPLEQDGYGGLTMALQKGWATVCDEVASYLENI